MKGLGYIGALIGGAITGAAIGILLAPKSGKDTRSEIKDAVEDLLKKYNIRPCKKDVEECVDKIEDAATADE